METNEKCIKTIKDYKSSPSRIIQSLGVSNQRLKNKNESRKSEMQRLSVRTRDLEESRDTWKKRAKHLSKELEEAQEKIARLEEKKR